MSQLKCKQPTGSRAIICSQNLLEIRKWVCWDYTDSTQKTKVSWLWWRSHTRDRASPCGGFEGEQARPVARRAEERGGWGGEGRQCRWEEGGWGIFAFQQSLAPASDARNSGAGEKPL